MPVKHSSLTQWRDTSMLTRLRSTWLASAGAILLALSISGIAAAALVTSVAEPTTEAPIADVEVSTIATFEDLDGDSVDDDCDDAVTADEAAAAAAATAVDVDTDGVISKTEAAHSDRVGGTNCNHGGYVSNVTSAETPEEDVEDAADAARAECEAATEPVVTVEPVVAVVLTVEEARAAHHKAVQDAAHSTDVGGKNCNHGGLVSEAAKKDQAAAKELRAQAKELRAQERAAAKAAKTHGKGHTKP